MLFRTGRAGVCVRTHRRSRLPVSCAEAVVARIVCSDKTPINSDKEPEYNRAPFSYRTWERTADHVTIGTGLWKGFAQLPRLEPVHAFSGHQLKRDERLFGVRLLADDLDGGLNSGGTLAFSVLEDRRVQPPLLHSLEGVGNRVHAGNNDFVFHLRL